MRIHHMANVDWFHFANKDHAVDKLSGLPALKTTFYRREHIVNMRRLIQRVALLEVKKKIINWCQLSVGNIVSLLLSWI